MPAISMKREHQFHSVEVINRWEKDSSDSVVNITISRKHEDPREIALSYHEAIDLFNTLNDVLNADEDDDEE